MSLRIIGDFIELDCERVARLLPQLRLTLLDRLTAPEASTRCVRPWCTSIRRLQPRYDGP
jgi:hypothetical protein